MPTATPDAPTNLPIPVTNQALILKESQGLTTTSPYSMPMLSGEEVDVSGKAITFVRLVHAFRRRYLLATFVGLLLAGTVGTVVWMMMPDNYEVTAYLKFTNQTGPGEWRGVITPEVFDNAAFRATQKEIITSDIVLQMALEDDGKKKEPNENNLTDNKPKGPPIATLPIFKGVDPKTRMKSMLSVMMPTGSDLMLIKLTGNSPEEQVKILQAIINRYLIYQSLQDTDPIAAYSAKLKKELDTENLNFETESKKYYEDLNISNDPSSHEVQKKMELLRSDMARAENRLLAKDAEIGETKKQIVSAKWRLEQQKNNEYSDLLIENYYKEYDNYNEAKAFLSQANKHYNEIASRLANNPRNPQLLQAKQQVLEANKMLEEIKKELRPVVLKKLQLAGDPSNGGLPVAILESNLKQQEDEAEQLKKIALDLRDDFQKRNQAQTDLIKRKRNMDEINGKIINIERAKADQDHLLKSKIDNPRVKEIKSPEVPASGSGLYRLLFSGLAAVLCFMFGAGSIVLIESLKHRVNNLDEITLPGPGMRVLGTIPNLGRIRGKSAETTSAVLAESIDTVRTKILQGKNRNLLHAILVTSAGESEGKTTVATHLAASLARAGRSTLLIDGDLRQPSIHLLFGIPQQAGFCEILRGEAEIDDAVQPAQLEGLHLLQAGQCDHVALSMLVKEQGAELFQTLRSKFDYIVIDSGPVLGYADALQLGHYTDAAVLSVLRDVSRLPMVYEAREQLEAVGVPILGAVVGRMAAVQRTPAAA